MIVLLWQRWLKDGYFRWLALCLALLVLDLIVCGAFLAWEVRLIREAW